MGTEFYIVDEENNECYCLGKGNWYKLSFLSDINAYIEEFVKPSFDKSTKDSYFDDVASEIKNFIENRTNLKLMIDESFGDLYYTQHSICKDIPNRVLCKEVGTRYRTEKNERE